MKLVDTYDDFWIDRYRKPNMKISELWVNRLNIERSNEFIKLHKNKKNLKILEIGPGGGSFASMVLASNEIEVQSYTLVDHQRVFGIMDEAIKNNKKVSCIRANRIDTLSAKKFDVLVSTICLSETNKLFREYLYKNIFPNCKEVFVVDGGTGFKAEFEKIMPTLYKDFKIIKWEEDGRIGRKLYLAKQ